VGSLGRWAAGASAPLRPDRDRLAETLEVLHGRLTEHLAAEEQHLLPLAAANPTPAEWAELGREGMAGTPKDQLPRMMGSIMPRLMMPLLAPRAYGRRVYGGTLPHGPDVLGGWPAPATRRQTCRAAHRAVVAPTRVSGTVASPTALKRAVSGACSPRTRRHSRFASDPA
jgi:hypothetical protein